MQIKYFYKQKNKIHNNKKKKKTNINKFKGNKNKI